MLLHVKKVTTVIQKSLNKQSIYIISIFSIFERQRRRITLQTIIPKNRILDIFQIAPKYSEFKSSTTRSR